VSMDVNQLITPRVKFQFSKKKIHIASTML